LPKVGLIGIGLVGKALAERLLKAGFHIVGFDIDPRCADELKRLGGEAVSSSAAVAQAADVCLLSLPDSKIVARVVDEIISSLNGKLLIDTSTGDPVDSAALGEKLQRHGIGFVDATIVGSSKQVRNGEVIVLAGGEAPAFRQSMPLFSTFAKQSFHLGPCGSGASMKLVVNLVLGLNRAVLAEGLTFAEGCGIDAAQALEVLKSSMAYSRIMDTKGEKMLKRDFSVEAKLSQHHKDVRLILSTAQQASAPVPFSATHDQVLNQAESLGFGEMDNSAIIEAFRRSKTE
jgi:3-hydroxyisobutyrate dehydrogenase-like beta-hydroxyacid dehydrogenase